MLTDASFPATMLLPILALLIQLIAMCGLGSAIASIVLLVTACFGAFLIAMLVLSALDKPVGARVVGHFLSGPGALGRLRSVMSFRIELPDGSYETVLIGGHEDGIEFGDEVAVRGYPARARLRATRVSNATEGSTLRDLSLATLVLVLWLMSLSLVVSGIAAIGAGFSS